MFCLLLLTWLIGSVMAIFRGDRCALDPSPLLPAMVDPRGKRPDHFVPRISGANLAESGTGRPPETQLLFRISIATERHPAKNLRI